jgi:hypothetical protein
MGERWRHPAKGHRWSILLRPGPRSSTSTPAKVRCTQEPTQAVRRYKLPNPKLSHTCRLGFAGSQNVTKLFIKKKINPYRFLLNGWCSENQTSDIHQNRGNGVQPRGSSEDQQKSQSGFGDFYSHIHRSGPWGSSQKIWKFPTKPMVSRGPSPTCPCVRQVQRVILSALKTLGAGSCPNCWEGIRYLNDLV